MDITSLTERAQQDQVRQVEFIFTDILGGIKSMITPIERLADTLQYGLWFDGSSIPEFKGIFESDMLMMPDPATYVVLPLNSTDAKRARLICDLRNADGSPFPGDPRFALRRALNHAARMGYGFHCGPEMEFFLFQEGAKLEAPQDEDGNEVRTQIVQALQNQGIEIEAHHHERAKGQHEIDFRSADALTMADALTSFKLISRMVARRHGLVASLMPKPLYGENGSGMHTHQALVHLESQQNAFFEADGLESLNEVGLSFVAGLLEHAQALAAIVAPTVNSYKRLVPGFEAPTYICWSPTNRSALIRIPRFSPGQEQAARIELRCPDPTANPYLAFASILRAGLDGIEQGLAAPPLVTENMYDLTRTERIERGIDELPGTLGEALEALEGDRVIRDALGPHIFPAYLTLRREEWDEYRLDVSQWERDRYLKIV